MKPSERLTQNAARSITLRWGGENYHICARPEECSCDESTDHESSDVEFVDEQAASEFLRRFGDDAFLELSLRSLLESEHTVSLVQRRKDTDVLAEAARLLAIGRLRVVRCWHIATSVPAPEAKPPVPPPDRPRPVPVPPTLPIKPVKTWVEIELVDQDERPVAGERYRLVLPDGSTRTGKLGETGRVFVGDIDPGMCQVSFPDIHEKEWWPH